MTNYRRRKRPQKVAPTFHRTNRQIRYNEVRVIDENGLVGVMTSGQAIAMAEERNVDLVELNPKATPPVVKLMDYNKFKYQLSKTDGKPKVLKDKTIRVSVRIGPHDLLVQARKCDEFLQKGVTVKLQVQMKGREKAHPEVAEEVLIEFIKLIAEPFAYIQEPKLVGDSNFATIKSTKPPVIVKVKKSQNADDQNDEELDDSEDDDEYEEVDELDSGSDNSETE
jgi:translation initiation factor IF-3